MSKEAVEGLTSVDGVRKLHIKSETQLKVNIFEMREKDFVVIYPLAKKGAPMVLEYYVSKSLFSKQCLKM